MKTQPTIITRLLRLGFYVTAVVVAGFVLYPNLQLPEPALTKGFTDKIYHVIGCMTLVLLAAAAWRVPTWMLLLAIPLSVGLEFIQGVAPGRGVHMADMIANMAGVALAMVLFTLGVGRGKAAR